MKHFLIVYDGRAGRVESVRKFRRPGPALAAYEVEEARLRDVPDAKVVLIGATSLDEVKVTHANIFGDTSFDELVRELIGS